MATPGFLSKRVKKKPQIGLTSDRYEFLGLDQAEPDLGDPIIGPSSIGANPPPFGSTQYVLVSASGNAGKRYWIPTANLSTGLIPGSFTVYSNNNQIGLANSFNKFNFVGSGVTVDPVGLLASDQTGIATVRISVVDVNASGNVNSIQYKASDGFLGGAPDFVYSSGSIGIGTTQPTATLQVVGTMKVSGIITGTATTANNLSDAANITTGTISSSRLSGTYPISITGTATTANNVSSIININTSGIITASSFVGNLTGTATTASGLSTTININTSGIITATKFYGDLYGNLSSTGFSFDEIKVTGLSTFTNGPVLIGSTTSTGTANQPLQVTGSAYIAGDGFVALSIGTTANTTYPVDIRLTSTTTGAVIRIAPITTTRPAGIVYSNGGSSNMWTGVLNSAGAGQNLSGFPAYAGLVGLTAGTTPLIFATNATERVRVFDTGEVGIGTTTLTGTTAQRLQVSSGVYISGNLGIGNTNPLTPLQVETYGIKTGVGTFSASVGVSTTIDSFSVSSADFKTAEYTVHISFGSSIQAQKVLVMQDQTTAYSEEYAVMYNNLLLVSIGATISGGNCILQATPQTGVSGLTTYRFARNTLS